MKNLAGLMKQAQQLQSRMEEAQKELEDLEVSGSAGGGLVTVTVTGKGALKRVKIDPSLATPDEVEILEDLVVAAANDARAKAEAAAAEKMQSLAGDLPLPPGLNLGI